MVNIISPHLSWKYTKTPAQELRERQDEEELLARLIYEQQLAQQQTANAAVAAGAGGVPEYRYFNPDKTTVLNSNITTADGPVTIQFTNASSDAITRYGTFVLNFGDGETSTNPNISHLYTSTGSFSASLVSTSPFDNVSTTATVVMISSSIPTVTATFTYTTSSKTGLFTGSFVNTGTTTSQTPSTIQYKMYFGDNRSASISVNGTSYTVNAIDSTTTFTSYNNVNHYYFITGSITASAQMTGSYGVASRYTQSWYQA